MAFHFPDDIIFGDFVDANTDSLLEEECMIVIERLFRQASMLVGEEYLLSLAERIGVDLYAEYGISKKDAEKAIKEQGTTSDLAGVLEKWWSAPTYSQPFALKVLNLRMYAMIGALDIDAATPKELHDEVCDLISWSDHLLEDVLTESSEKFLCFFTRAARARLDLDLGRNPRIDDFTSLASLARHPHSEPVTDAVLQLPTKTIQNLISARTLTRIGEDRLEHSSAHKWMLKQWSHEILYPSSAMRVAEERTLSKPISDPVFVPVISGTAFALSEPYLPEHRNEGGYWIETTEGEQKIDDYWKALEVLQHTAPARVRIREHSHLLVVGRTWQVFDRLILQQMVENEQPEINSSDVGLCAATARLIDRHPNISVHRKGHSKKMYRYICSNGEELAIEKRPGRPLIYVVASPENLTAFADHIIRKKGRGPSGRNSNLNSMDGFVDKELIVLRPETLEEARRYVNMVAGSADVEKN